jgi:hypothetical protein
MPPSPSSRKSQGSQKDASQDKDKPKKAAPKKPAAPAGADLRGWVSCRALLFKLTAVQAWRIERVDAVQAQGGAKAQGQGHWRRAHHDWCVCRCSL